MSRDRNEYQLAVAALKGVLKSQGISYRELAQGIGMSESGVKKVLSAEDGSFVRMTEMCRYAGVSLTDLLEGNHEIPADVTLPEKAQNYFLENPRAFSLYWCLVYERQSPEDAERRLKLKSAETFRLLRELDRMELIDLLPGGRVRVPAIRPINWVGDGPLIRKLYKEWSARVVSEVAKPDLSGDQLFLIRYFQMHSKTYGDFLMAQRDLEREFLRRGTIDMRTRSPQLKHVRWVTAIDDKSFLD